MRKINTDFLAALRGAGLFLALFGICTSGVFAQDTLAKITVTKRKFVKNTFGDTRIIDNQTVMVSPAKTMEFDLEHRFGVVTNGYSDFYGIWAPANIRIGMTYAPINNLMFGYGVCKERWQMDGSVKYAIFKQAASGGWPFSDDGGWPVSVTYYGDMAIDTRDKSNFVSFTDRISYFNQLLIARKITTKFSAQVAPSLSYFNNVEGYINSEGGISPKMKNAHFAIAFMGRYKLTPTFGLVANYDQPLTQHPTNNPHPNIAFGIEVSTISHTFQFFLGNYYSILPQSNNVFNQNDYTKGEWLIGFNITRNWYYQK